MTTIIACCIAFVSTMAFLTLWFVVIYRELRVKRNMVEAALCQLNACENLIKLKDNKKSEDELCIYNRSLDIYRQSIGIYNQVLIKPWTYIPGRLMGFKEIYEE